MVNFPNHILTATLTVLLFWIYLFPLTLVFVLHWLSIVWETLIMLLSQFLLTFLRTQKGVTLFITQLMSIFMLIDMVM